MMSKKILLVESPIVEAVKTGQLLKKAGYEVQIVQAGLEVASCITKFNPDLLILHTQLPDVDSFALCKALKTNLHTHLLPIIMLGQQSSRLNNAVHAYEVGAEYYCDKNEHLHTTLPVLTRVVFARVGRRPFPSFWQIPELLVF